jgi:DNA-binding response OmpR family regulator
METPAPKARILLVEDEVDIAEFVATELRFEGYEVRVEHDGMRGMIAARQDPPDLLILDRMLPGLDGIEFTRRLRKTSDLPIILLTARGEPRERVEGLNAGANDYLAKPFDLDELIARVNAQLRAHKPRPKTTFIVGDLSLDAETREVKRGNLTIALTPKEFDLLKYLIASPRQVRTREQILEAVWSKFTIAICAIRYNVPTPPKSSIPSVGSAMCSRKANRRDHPPASHAAFCGIARGGRPAP